MSKVVSCIDQRACVQQCRLDSPVNGCQDVLECVLSPPRHDRRKFVHLDLIVRIKHRGGFGELATLDGHRLVDSNPSQGLTTPLASTQGKLTLDSNLTKGGASG